MPEGSDVQCLPWPWASHTRSHADTLAQTHAGARSRTHTQQSQFGMDLGNDNKQACNNCPKVTLFLPNPEDLCEPIVRPNEQECLPSLYGHALKRTFIICYNTAPSSPNDIIKHNSMRTSSSCVLLFLIYPSFYFKFLSPAGLKLLHCHSVGVWGAARLPPWTTAKTGQRKRKNKDMADEQTKPDWSTTLPWHERTASTLEHTNSAAPRVGTRKNINSLYTHIGEFSKCHQVCRKRGK